MAGAHIDLDRRHQELGRGKRRVARLAHGHELILADAILHMLVEGAFVGDRRLPGIGVAARRLVVVTHEKARLRRQGEQPLDGAIELARITAGEVGPGRAEVRHEQRVADEDRLADLVGDVGRRMPRHVHDLDLERAERETLTIGKQVVELAAVAAQIGRVEYGPKDLLHVADMLADADLGPGLELDIGRAGEVVGMGMRLENPVEGEAVLLGRLEDHVGRLGRGLAARVIVVEHRVDHRGALRLGIRHEIAHRVGGLVEEGLDRGRSGHWKIPFSNRMPMVVD